MNPTLPPAFDLSSYLSDYRPRHLDLQVWSKIHPSVTELITRAEPAERKETSDLLSALSRFLPAAAGRGPVSLELLTIENVDHFCAIERARGVSEATLGQVRPLLRRLVKAYRSTASPVDLGPQWPRFTEFDPYTDAEFESLSRLADTLPADLGRALRCALSLVGLHGLSRAQMETATVTDGILTAATLDHPRQLAASDPLLVLAQGADVSVSKATWACLRLVVKAETGMPLRMHRLRVRWLLQVLSTDQPVARRHAHLRAGPRRPRDRAARADHQPRCPRAPARDVTAWCRLHQFAAHALSTPARRTVRRPEGETDVPPPVRCRRSARHRRRARASRGALAAGPAARPVLREHPAALPAPPGRRSPVGSRHRPVRPRRHAAQPRSRDRHVPAVAVRDLALRRLGHRQGHPADPRGAPAPRPHRAVGRRQLAHRHQDHVEQPSKPAAQPRLPRAPRRRRPRPRRGVRTGGFIAVAQNIRALEAWARSHDDGRAPGHELLKARDDFVVIHLPRADAGQWDEFQAWRRRHKAA